MCETAHHRSTAAWISQLPGAIGRDRRIARFSADAALPDVPHALASFQRRADFSRPCGARFADLLFDAGLRLGVVVSIVPLEPRIDRPVEQAASIAPAPASAPSIPRCEQGNEQGKRRPCKNSMLQKSSTQEPPHDLLYPITLYADDDASAEAAVRKLSDVVPGDHVTIRAVRPLHESFFGRSSTDGRGTVQHSDISWSSKGPFEPIDLFEPQSDA